MNSVSYIAVPSHGKVPGLIRLPFEIKDHIMSYCDTSRALAYLSLVHSSLKAPAERLIYSSISLYEKTPRETLCLKTLSQRPEKCALIRSVIFMLDQPNLGPGMAHLDDQHLLHLSMALENMNRLRHLSILTPEWRWTNEHNSRQRISEILRGNYFKLKTLSIEEDFIDLNEFILKQPDLEALMLYTLCNTRVDKARADVDKLLAHSDFITTTPSESPARSIPTILAYQYNENLIDLLVPTLQPTGMQISDLFAFYTEEWSEYLWQGVPPHWHLHFGDDCNESDMLKVAQHVHLAYPKKCKFTMWIHHSGADAPATRFEQQRKAFRLNIGYYRGGEVIKGLVDPLRRTSDDDSDEDTVKGTDEEEKEEEKESDGKTGSNDDTQFVY